MSHPQGAEKQESATSEEHVKPPPPTTATETTPATLSKPQDAELQDVSDPDEDDLDDLDDMLDDFAAVKVDSQKPTAAAPPSITPGKEASTGQSTTATAPQSTVEDEFSEAEFAKQLQAGMADLIGELDKSPDMQAQFEEIFKQLAAEAPAEASKDAKKDGTSAGPSAGPSETARGSNQPAGGDASFQETIRRTMERMQNSGEQATAAAASSSEDDLMAELLKQLSSGDLNAEGSEEDFSKMLMGMMDQLTNKEILYEPMKELSDKFPQWLEKNKATTSAEDFKRYEEQKKLATEIVAKFEETTYSDSNAADREYIVDRMQKMQAAGSPPSDLVGDMPSAQDAFSMPDEQCNPQ